MGLYSHTFLPWLCDLALDRPLVARHRRELLSNAGGDVLEVGLGTGLNLPHYPEHVRSLTSVDPNPGMHRRARRRIEQTGIHVARRLLGGEQLPFEGATCDCVASTFTLCSIELPTRPLPRSSASSGPAVSSYCWSTASAPTPLCSNGSAA